jgi:uncharacterized membrane protein SirB2
MTGFEVAKSIHVTCVVLSLASFIARFTLAARGALALHHPVARVLPHVNDTILLTAAIVMLATLRLNPMAAGWLIAKIAGLIAYILLGMIAMRRTRPWPARRAAFAAALLVFGYVVSVALSKSPLGLAAWIIG